MRFSLFTTALLALTASTALADMYITSPVASTSANGGSHLTIEWLNRGNPSISQWEGINLWLTTGDTNNQYKLDVIGTNISTSRRSRRYRIPANVGPSGQYYFIRAESTATAANGTAEHQAFSAKFTLNEMRGTFNATVLAAAHGTASPPSTTTTRGSSVSRPTGPSTSTSSIPSNSSAIPISGANNNTSAAAELAFRPQAVVLGALGAVAAGVAVLL